MSELKIKPLGTRVVIEPQQAETKTEAEAPVTDGIPEEKDEKPAGGDKETDQAFVKILKVTKKKASNDKIQFFIFSVGETMYSTFDEKVAKLADGLKGKDTEVLVAYDIVKLGDKTYFNISKGDAEAVFIIQ